ncbi:alpha/beta hydrolase [Curvibacter sp. APW13]|uniref:alpha/beta fold hydrolase n=1 Tax=Curvibacter sp. APW13 TaxID=3077236 RepID=UPI0028DD941C|nr:alpha/beta hydrolase [Curvibacter sp. APW13]MDT8990349.1 alpha/beta hydrolase [Curvibacter sp. APW13]
MKQVAKVVAWLLATVLALVLLTVAVFWERDRTVAELAPRWAQAPSQMIEVMGMQVHIRDEGPRDDPIPIVLLHGTSDSLHCWNGWVAALSPQRRVIRFDLPAFGLTGPQPDGDYSIAMYVRFVLAVMDKLQVPRAVVGGNSLGGQIAWGVAVAAPQRVERLILVDAAGYPLQPKSVPIGFQIARLPGVRSLMEYVLPRGVIESSVRNVYGQPEKVTPELVDRFFELTLREGNRKALAQRMDQRLWGDQDKIKTIRQPTLILWGAQDRLVPLENAEKFHADIAGSQLVVFDALGHVPHEEDPQATALAVRRFLQLK